MAQRSRKAQPDPSARRKIGALLRQGRRGPVHGWRLLRPLAVAAVLAVAAAGLVAGNPPSVYQPYAGSLSPVLLSSLSERPATPEPPSPSVSVVPSASPTPRPSVTPTPRPHKTPPPVKPVGPRVSGTASWYCNSDPSRGKVSACRVGYPDRPRVDDLFAAAGPPLKRLLGPHWQGQYVVVCVGKACVRVRLVDGCACPHRAIDLYADAFQRLFSLSRGLIERVTISRAGAS